MNTRKIISVLFLTLAALSALALFRENNSTPAATGIHSKGAKGEVPVSLTGR
jgi:hypothetical protein